MKYAKRYLRKGDVPVGTRVRRKEGEGEQAQYVDMVGTVMMPREAAYSAISNTIAVLYDPIEKYQGESIWDEPCSPFEFILEVSEPSESSEVSEEIPQAQETSEITENGKTQTQKCA
jgi:hypothetical protein